MARKYLKAARAELNMTQAEVARAVGAVRNTIIKLESGGVVDEGIEGRVEKLYGWAIGSLDTIRAGGRPTPADVEVASVPASQLAVREMADCILEGKDVGPLAKYWQGRLDDPDEIWPLIDEAHRLAKREATEGDPQERDA